MGWHRHLVNVTSLSLHVHLLLTVAVVLIYHLGVLILVMNHILVSHVHVVVANLVMVLVHETVVLWLEVLLLLAVVLHFFDVLLVSQRFWYWFVSSAYHHFEQFVHVLFGAFVGAVLALVVWLAFLGSWTELVLVFVLMHFKCEAVVNQSVFAVFELADIEATGILRTVFAVPLVSLFKEL